MNGIIVDMSSIIYDTCMGMENNLIITYKDHFWKPKIDIVVPYQIENHNNSYTPLKTHNYCLINNT